MNRIQRFGRPSSARHGTTEVRVHHAHKSLVVIRMLPEASLYRLRPVMSTSLISKWSRQLGAFWQVYLLPHLLAWGILKRRGTFDSGGIGVPFPVFSILILLIVGSILLLALFFLVPPGVSPYP